MAFRAVEADQMVVMRIGIEFFSAFCDSIKRLMAGIALGRFDSRTGRRGFCAVAGFAGNASLCVPIGQEMRVAGCSLSVAK